MIDGVVTSGPPFTRLYAHKVALRGRKPTHGMYRLLSSHLDEYRGVAGLAERLGLHYGVVARWLEEDEERRTVPSPEACVLIARKLGYDPVSLFKLAGYLPDDGSMIAPPAWDDDLRDLIRRGKRVGRRASSLAVWEMLRPAIAADVNKWQQLLDDYEALVSRRQSQANGEDVLQAELPPQT